MTKNISAKERREEIKGLIAEKGLFAINKSALGRKYDVSDVMIGKDIDKIIREIPDEKIENIVYELQIHFKRALHIADSLLNSQDDNIRLKAVDKLTQAIERFNRFLEAFGKKPITPELLDINKKEFKIEYMISNDQKAIAKFRDYVCKRSINENKSPFLILGEIFDLDIRPSIDSVRAMLKGEVDPEFMTDFEEFRNWCEQEKKDEGIRLLKEFNIHQKWENYKITVGRFYKTKDGEFDREHFKLYLENCDNLYDP